MPFALVLVVFGFNSPDMFYAIETGMTAESCAVRIEEQQILLEKTFAVADFELMCESYDAGE